MTPSKPRSSKSTPGARAGRVAQARLAARPGMAGPDTIPLDAWPSTGFAAPGHRLFAGHAEAGVGDPPPPLAAGYLWEIGTVGAVVTDGPQRYALSAAHVVTNPYAPGATFPDHCRVGFSAGDPALTSDNFRPIVPATPLVGTLTIDVVALPLTPAQALQSEQPLWSVAPPGALERFREQAVVICVERGDSIVELPGTLETDVDEHTATWEVGHVRLGPTLIIRCDGPLPTVGDSGAPVLVNDPSGNEPTLLGFHIACIEETAVAYAMVAWPVLERTGLGLAT